MDFLNPLRPKDNPNPQILSESDMPERRARRHISYTVEKSGKITIQASKNEDMENAEAITSESIDQQDIYDLVASINDPEHPFSLGSLAVVNIADIHIKRLSCQPTTPLTLPLIHVTILLTPTTPHCSLATIIGLAVHIRLRATLPPNFRVDVLIKPNTHTAYEAVSKQLCDKERVAAAQENQALMSVIHSMLASA